MHEFAGDWSDTQIPSHATRRCCAVDWRPGTCICTGSLVSRLSGTATTMSPLPGCRGLWLGSPVAQLPSWALWLRLKEQTSLLVQPPALPPRAGGSPWGDGSLSAVRSHQAQRPAPGRVGLPRVRDPLSDFLSFIVLVWRKQLRSRECGTRVWRPEREALECETLRYKPGSGGPTGSAVTVLTIFAKQASCGCSRSSVSSGFKRSTILDICRQHRAPRSPW